MKQTRPLIPVTIVLAGMISGAASGDGPAPRWTPDLFPSRGPNDWVAAAIQFDDGSGETLYIGGFLSAVDNQITGPVARWDGATWSAVGGNIEGSVSAFASFDDGTGNGEQLYAGGEFVFTDDPDASNVARWNGTTWEPVGDALFDDDVRDLVVFDDGSGPALYAGGSFDSISGEPIQSIARWNGMTWTPVGAFSETESAVNDLEVFFDDPSGTPSLYAGGWTNTPALKNLARWDGTAWSPVNTFIDDPVVSIARFDDGAGPRLAIAMHSSSSQDPARVLTWNGTNIGLLFTLGRSAEVSLREVEVAGVSHLYIAGSDVFVDTTAGRQRSVLMWDGNELAQVGDDPPLIALGGELFPVHLKGRSVLLEVGFHWTGGHVALWDGTAWTRLGDEQGFDLFLNRLQVLDLGSGPMIYALGSFQNVGGHSNVNGLARWNGTDWEPLGANGFILTIDELLNLAAVAAFDDRSGAGKQIHVIGTFDEVEGTPVGSIAKRTATGWVEVGGGLDTGMHGFPVDMTVFQDELYVAGALDGAGGIQSEGIVRWTGSTWRDVGGGVTGSAARFAHFEDKLVVVGPFSHGASGAESVALWNGNSWEPVGSPESPAAFIEAVAVVHDPSGPTLYIATHDFNHGSATERIGEVKRWNGAQWETVGEQFSFTNSSVSSERRIHDLIVYDDGTGAALYAVGHFDRVGKKTINHVARWNGSTWVEVQGGVGTSRFERGNMVQDGTVFDDGFGPALFVGGTFTIAGRNCENPVVSSQIARYGPPRNGDRLTSLLNFDVLFGSHVEGGLVELASSDNIFLQTRSQIGFSAAESNLTEIILGAQTSAIAPAHLTFTIESRINNPGGTAIVKVRNWDTGTLEVIHAYPLEQQDTIETINNVDAQDRVRAGDGRIEFAIRHAVVATFSAAGFDSFFDHTRVLVD